jgi:hypothetical protein
VDKNVVGTCVGEAKDDDKILAALSADDELQQLHLHSLEQSGLSVCILKLTVLRKRMQKLKLKTVIRMMKLSIYLNLMTKMPQSELTSLI